MIHAPRRTSRATFLIAFATTCAVGGGSLTGPSADAIQLRKIRVDPNSGQVTLRWESQNGKTYAIEETSNPELGWQQSVGEIPGDSRETMFSLLPRPAHQGAGTLLFRVRESTAEPEAKDTAGAGGLTTGTLCNKETAGWATSAAPSLMEIKPPSAPSPVVASPAPEGNRGFFEHVKPLLTGG